MGNGEEWAVELSADLNNRQLVLVGNAFKKGVIGILFLLVHRPLF